MQSVIASVCWPFGKTKPNSCQLPSHVAACKPALSELTRSCQAAFGARLAFLVIANPALEPMIRDAVEDSGNAVVAAAYNATNGDSEDVVVRGLASPA
jgi:hypothetical protein